MKKMKKIMSKVKGFLFPEEPSKWRLWGCFFLFYIMILFCGYLILSVARWAPPIKSTQGIPDLLSLFSIQANFYSFVIGRNYIFLTIIGLIFFIASLLYFFVLRKVLLEKHRLFYLADVFSFGSGLRTLGLSAIICLILAVVFYRYLLTQDPICICTPNKIIIHILISIFSGTLSMWLLHLLDYHWTCRFLLQNKEIGFDKTINFITTTWTLRTDNYEEFRKKDKEEFLQTSHDLDDLYDREQDIKTIPELIKQSKEYLEKLKGDEEGIGKLLKRHGNIVALFHPDYLPHLSHIYLKLSQLRALNIPPRRMQFLCRRWTVRGLESEYILVHNISELRPEYLECQENIEGIVKDKILGKKISGEGNILEKIKDGLQLTKNDKILDDLFDVIIDLIKRWKEPKWRQKSLKKRATVIVAPDGSLVQINIEEERQFNI